MDKTIEAIYDGEAFVPKEPVSLKPNTRVRLTFETTLTAVDEITSFLDVALSLNLEGPPDWSEKLEEYLYGGNEK